jgi:hypothetical protein
MRRYLYYNLLKIVLGFLLALVFIPSFTYLICSLLIDKNVNIISLILTLSCIFLWYLLTIIIYLLNKRAKNSIIFSQGIMQYKNRTIYADSISIKYFKFHISVIEPSLVVPQMHINGNGLSVTCYFSKKDVEELKKLKFEIIEV